MMKSTDPRQSNDSRLRRSAFLGGSASWRNSKASVDAILFVVRSVFSEQSTQMDLVEYHEVIEQLAADRAYPALFNSVLPWATH